MSLLVCSDACANRAIRRLAVIGFTRRASGVRREHRLGRASLALVDPARWEQLRVERALEPGETLALCFDGSDTHDATALVAITADGVLIPVEIIERPVGADDDWRVDRAWIHRAVERMFTGYQVSALYGDAWGWRSELAGWAERWPDRVLELPMNSPTRAAELVDRFRTTVSEGSLHHDGDPDLRRHVLNARLRKVGRSEDGLGRYAVAKAGGRLIERARRRSSPLRPTRRRPRPSRCGRRRGEHTQGRRGKRAAAIISVVPTVFSDRSSRADTVTSAALLHLAASGEIQRPPRRTAQEGTQ